MTEVVDIRVKGEFCGELVRKYNEGMERETFLAAFGENATIYIIIVWRQRKNEMRLLLPSLSSSSSNTHKRCSSCVPDEGNHSHIINIYKRYMRGEFPPDSRYIKRASTEGATVKTRKSSPNRPSP